MRLKNFLKLLLFLITLLWLNHSIYSQIAGKDFQLKIPADSQKQLAERIDLYVKYHREKDWENLYDLLYEKRDKKTFVEDQKKSSNDADFSLADFTSLTAFFPDDSMPNWIIVEGCANIHKNKDKGKKFKAFVNAYKVNEVWIFTMIELMRQVGREPESCDSKILNF